MTTEQKHKLVIEELTDRFSSYPKTMEPSAVFLIQERPDLWDAVDVRIHLNFPLEKTMAPPKEIVIALIEKYFQEPATKLFDELRGLKKDDNGTES